MDDAFRNDESRGAQTGGEEMRQGHQFKRSLLATLRSALCLNVIKQAKVQIQQNIYTLDPNLKSLFFKTKGSHKLRPS